MTQDQRRRNWDVVLRRRPAHAGRGGAASGWTDEFEIVCRQCGDDPNLDYRQASPELQRLRGPYQMAAGVAAFERHARQHPEP